jgi:hypothetical protein
MVRAKKEVDENEVNNEFKKIIKFINKDDKQRSLIIDAFRVIGWQEFKSEYKLSGLEGYQEFHEVWCIHEIHQMSLNELQVMYSGLGYSLSDLVKIRNDYYAARRTKQDVLQESNFSGDEPPF